MRFTGRCYRNAGILYLDQVIGSKEGRRLSSREAPETQPGFPALPNGYLTGGEWKMNEYITHKEHIFENEPLNIKSFCEKNELSGTEIFFDDLVPRTWNLFSSETERVSLIYKLRNLQVKRLHCSYWAYPTSFLTKNNFTELITRFGGIEQVRAYYGDLTGSHIWKRWAQEYEIASALNAQAYTFHLIDYAPIDGEWAFTIPINDIRQAMIFMIQQFLLNLEELQLLTGASPCIEIENAGWGLEYGTQSKNDYITLFEQLNDPGNKVKIGWDINHLLHAAGKQKGRDHAYFMLPEEEKNDEMRVMEAEYGNNPALFSARWLEYNILAPELRQRAGSIHLSDCALKDVEFFVHGKSSPPYSDKMDALATWEEKEDYGVKIVLEHYDSHLPLETGVLKGRDVKDLLLRLHSYSKEFVILHELKNSESIQKDFEAQKRALNWS
jgi:hypothetical protein